MYKQTYMTRQDFRERCTERDNKECTVPICPHTVTSDPDESGEVHHILERKLWEEGGYIPDNGATVCNFHHRLAETDIIPPQAFWRWIEVEEPPLPQGIDSMHVDKWGESLEEPPWKEHRERIKYPSTQHLPWSHESDRDDTSFDTLESFIGVPLVGTIKMDGSNCMLVSDEENPVRARNGKHAGKAHFDLCKKMYWENNLYEKIPDHLQIFGEWIYAKHSIHYGCDCDEDCEDIGPALKDYFQVFGIYDMRYDLWLGWGETYNISKELNLTVVPPVINTALDIEKEREVSDYVIGKYDNKNELWEELVNLSNKIVEKGHEGIVVRSALPFHYSQIDKRLGKYVREGHVKEGEKHWSKRELVQNRVED